MSQTYAFQPRYRRDNGLMDASSQELNRLLDALMQWRHKYDRNNYILDEAYGLANKQYEYEQQLISQKSSFATDAKEAEPSPLHFISNKQNTIKFSSCETSSCETVESNKCNYVTSDHTYVTEESDDVFDATLWTTMEKIKEDTLKQIKQTQYQTKTMQKITDKLRTNQPIAKTVLNKQAQVFVPSLNPKQAHKPHKPRLDVIDELNADTQQPIKIADASNTCTISTNPATANYNTTNIMNNQIIATPLQTLQTLQILQTLPCMPNISNIIPCILPSLNNTIPIVIPVPPFAPIPNFIATNNIIPIPMPMPPVNPCVSININPNTTTHQFNHDKQPQQMTDIIGNGRPSRVPFEFCELKMRNNYNYTTAVADTEQKGDEYQPSYIKPVPVMQDMDDEIFEPKFNNHAKGNFFIAHEMTRQMMDLCAEMFNTRRLNDDNLAFGYYKESVAMQINDKQIRIIKTLRGQIVIINIDLHYKQTGDVLYLIAKENDIGHKDNVKWKIVEFMNAKMIRNVYGVTKLPKSSRNMHQFRHAMNKPAINVPMYVIDNTSFRDLPCKDPNVKRKKDKKGNIRRDDIAVLPRTRISESDLKYYCKKSWNNGVMIPVVVVKGKKQWVEWKKFITIKDYYQNDQWIGISLRYYPSNRQWQIECMDYDLGRIYYQHRLVGTDHNYCYSYNDLNGYVTTALDIN